MNFNRTEYLARAARKPRALPAEAIHEFELPSGTVVKLALPGPDVWMVASRLPQGLTISSFTHFLQGKLKGAEITDAHVQAIAELQRDLIAAALIEPRIVPDQATLEAGEIYYRDLTPEDAAAIFAWATRQREVARLETFRHVERVPAAGAGGDEVRPAPQRSRRRGVAAGGPGIGS